MLTPFCWRRTHSRSEDGFRASTVGVAASAVHLGVIFTQNCVVTGDQAGSGGGRCQWTPWAIPVVTVSGAGADVQGGVWRTAPDLCPSLLRLLPRLQMGPCWHAPTCPGPWVPSAPHPCRPSLRKGPAPQAEAPSSPALVSGAVVWSFPGFADTGTPRTLPLPTPTQGSPEPAAGADWVHLHARF